MFTWGRGSNRPVASRSRVARIFDIAPCKESGQRFFLQRVSARRPLLLCLKANGWFAWMQLRLIP